MERKVIVLRGIPSSGKSTKARELAKSVEGSVICSADDFFMKTGTYVFDPNLLRAAHQSCFRKFTKSLQDSVPLVIVDNTHTRKWEYEKYVEQAQEFGYEVEIVSLPHPDPEVAAARNLHGVGIEIIKKMIARWQDA